MLPVVRIGPASIPTAYVAFIAAVWLGSATAAAGCRRRGLKSETAWDVVGTGLAATIAAARLAYVVQNWPAYAADWLSVFALTPGALAIEPGLLVGLVAAAALLQRREISIARFADAAAPGALVAVAVIAAGQFLTGDAFGDTTTVPWAMSLYGELRHPVQLYEALAALAGAAVVWWAQRRSTADGWVALLAIVWYSGARLLVDAFRGDETLLWGEYRMTQVLALGVLLAALWGLSHLESRKAG